VSTIPESVERLQALDKSARDRLQAALTAATPPAFAKFAEMLSTLAETIPDEGARYKTALKLCAKERPADALLNDADVLIGAIEAASREFADTCKSQVDSKVGAKQAEIARLEADIAQAQNGIATLQASITKATSQRDALASGVVTEQQRIAQVQERFKGVYQIMHYELEVQKSKIVQFGKA
jgi:chromosome segregation ATPase